VKQIISPVIVVPVKANKAPITYNDKYYERHGNNNKELKGISEIKALEARFHE